MKNYTHKNFIIHEFEELKSTNSYAFELANLGKIFDREIILANSQTSGRGRQDRSWSSPLGNLYFSLILRPNVGLEKISQLSFVAITALQIAVKKLSKNSVQNKWPNDLLIDEKKVAGLLLESKISGKNCEFVILGIGLNINSNPDNTIFPAANLKDFGIEISKEEMLKNFLDEFEKIYQNWLDFGFDGIRKLWLQNAFRLKEKITVKPQGKQLEGVFEDFDLEGNLLLKIDEKIIKISAADVS
jgi:BirA family transcriptional regulator, biotin operon repressor / biotin---[acetyl-CoA-carboxylase] ligase